MLAPELDGEGGGVDYWDDVAKEGEGIHDADELAET